MAPKMKWKSEARRQQQKIYDRRDEEQKFH